MTMGDHSRRVLPHDGNEGDGKCRIGSRMNIFD